MAITIRGRRCSFPLAAALFGAAALAAPAIAQSPACAADLNHDGVINALDLAMLLGQWGPQAPCPPYTRADFDHSCTINGLDLGTLLGAWGVDCLPTVTQLAGNPLAKYPYFEYVRAFNQGAGFHVAIDPSRFPQLVGATADIYIVAHKTAAQWGADPSLADVTAGGFQTQTFTAGTIQANTFLISGSNHLNGTLGTQVGVGYDVVLDLNRDGMLDGGDVIDGPARVADVGDEAGMYVVRDVAAPGPYTPVTAPVYAVTGVGPGITLEQTYYPENIASLGQLPLVVVSHGSGHNFLWYGHIGNHMASYGYIVMAHQNDVSSGVGNGAIATIRHTNAFIGQQATILGGVLNGHIDGSNIVWIGHSRGGEGVVVAYDHIYDGTPLSGGPYVPVGWSVASVKLVDSMAPINYYGPSAGNPHGVPYHLWMAEGDADVTGCAGWDLVESFQLHGRGTGYKLTTSLYGAGHGDLHSSTAQGSVFQGPCPIGKPAANQIQRGYFLPIIEHFVHGDIPSKDFLWRQWERFRPIGAPDPGSCPLPLGTGDAVVVDLTYRDDPAAATFIIDDYMTNPDPGVSSSGAAVTYSVSNLLEGHLDDISANFNWTSADPMNGMTYAGAMDFDSGVVFDWTGPSYYEFEVPAAHRDWTGDDYLSFRACQGTRHPQTIAALEDLTFDVVLRDAGGATSRINIGAYGGGIEEPYERNGCGGGGLGWNNEFETIRIRVTDFLNNGAALNLGQVVAVRLEFAAPGSGTSAAGRLGLHEMYLTRE